LKGKGRDVTWLSKLKKVVEKQI